MGRFSTIIFGICLGVAGAYLAHEYHFVRARDEFLFVRKRAASWRDIYVDLRGWTPGEWREHSELSQNLVAAGHGRLIGHNVSENLIQHFRGSFGERPTHPPAHAPQHPRR